MFRNESNNKESTLITIIKIIYVKADFIRFVFGYT